MLPDAVLDSLHEFLVVYIHAVAYLGRVYPDDTFELVQQYGVATYENRHPGVRQWAETAAKSVTQLPVGTRTVVSILVLENGEAIDRIAIEIKEISGMPEQDEGELFEQYRGCLQRLLVSKRLPPSGADRSLTMTFEGEVANGNGDWIVAEGRAEKVPITPIRSATIGGGVLNIFRQTRHASHPANEH